MTNPTIDVADAVAALLADAPDASTFADPEGGLLELEMPLPGQGRARVGYNAARAAVVLTVSLPGPPSAEGLESLAALAHQARWRDGPIPGLDADGAPSLSHVLTGTPDARALDKVLRTAIETLEAAGRGQPAAELAADSQLLWFRI